MEDAAIGIRVHSGWGAVVAVCGPSGKEGVLERRRVAVVDSKNPGMKQPYHRAAEMNIVEAGKYLESCAAVSRKMALEALSQIVTKLKDCDCRVAGACILLSSGRPLPELPKILASHALIHTADGEFFRQAFRDALGALKIPTCGIREKDLEQQAGAVLGKAYGPLQASIAAMGKTLGPPWTTDQKNAMLAACVVLHRGLP